MVDSTIIDRIAALPEGCEERYAILRLFGCRTISAALLIFENASKDQRDRYESALREILGIRLS
jgi:hypothetical protein